MIRIPAVGEPKASGPNLSELLKLVAESPTPDRIATKIAKLLNVQRTEVAFLRVENTLLKFLHPPELRAAGAIPLSSNAVAARTAVTRTSLLSNNFLRVKHVNLFETVKLASDSCGTEFIETTPIQKLVSVPIESENGEVLGVVQVSRKGLDVRLAGPDFTTNELKLLEQIAPILAQMPFMDPSKALDAQI
jgi:GAF domain-containing protein